MSQAVSEFLSSLMVHYPFRHESEERETAWVRSMVGELRGFDSRVLGRAATEIIRHRTDRRFPLPADCRKACTEAKKWVDAEARASSLPVERQFDAKSPEYSDGRQKLANDLVMCPMGKQAAKEGWLGCLHAYAVKHGKLPPAGEIGGLKREADGFDKAYANCIRGGWPQAQMLEKLGAAMLKQRHELEDMVLHGVVK